MKTCSKILGLMALLPLAGALNCGATALWWTGITSSNWDLTTPMNWESTRGGFSIFATGNSVIFDDPHLNAAADSLVNVTANMQPASVTFTNNVNNYTLGGAGVIMSSGALNKSYAGTVTLNGTNSFSGGLNLSSGTLMLTASNTFGSASLVTGGSLNLNAANTFSSGLTIGNGTVTLGNANGAAVKRL